MTSPENNPGQPQPTPEVNETVKALEALKVEVQNKTLKDIVDAVKKNDVNAREVDVENQKRIEENTIEGTKFPGDELNPNTLAGKAKNVKEAVQSLLLAASGQTPKDFTPENLTDRKSLDFATNLTRVFLKQLNEKVGPENITPESAPYFHKFILSLLTGEIITMRDLQNAHNRFGKSLAAVSPFVYKKYHNAIVKTVSEVGGLKDADIKKNFANHSTDENEFLDRVNKRGDFSERKILEVIARDKYAKEVLELGKFYAAMESPDEFNSFYKELHEKNSTPDKLLEIEAIILKRKKNITPEALKIERDRIAKENTAKDVHARVIYLVNLFFKPVLISAPDQEFKATAALYGGQYSPNPENMFRQFTSRIGSLTNSIIGSAATTEDQPLYMALHQEGSQMIVPQQRTTLEKMSPMKEYTQSDFGTLVRQMKTLADTERNFMEFGHNFRYATNKGPSGDKGFFETIGGFAKESINTSDIDVITSVEYSELIQTAKIQLERRYKLAFSKARWQRDVQLFTKVFEETNKIDDDIRKSFIRDFAGDPEQQQGKYPEVIIDRCLAHARTLVYAKEFNLQLWASYADPRLEKGGQPSYSREELSGATAFSPVDDAIRWGDIADLNNNGELYLPTEGIAETNIFGKKKKSFSFKMDNYKKAVAKGKKEFHQSFTFGYAAFEKAPSTIAETGNNLTKGGGMDALGGYRLRQAYDQWLDGLMEERTNNREINVRNTKPDVMVEAWKRVENIGTNVLKNFTEQLFLTDLHKGEIAKGDEGVKEKYTKLFEFWYDRYLGDPESAGQAYVKDMPRDKYVSQLMDAVIKVSTIKDGDIKRAAEKEGATSYLESEQYKILSVVLFERSPLEFISMEKPRLTQNGVTLMSQVQNAFLDDQEIKAKEIDKKPLDSKVELDGAMEDLIYIEQKARMDSIQQMDEIRKSYKINEDPNNLYGDKTKERSQVMQMDGWAKNKKGGYVVDEQYIKEVLEKQYEKDPEELRNWKIRRAQKMYFMIREGMQRKPDDNDEIDIFHVDGKKEDYESFKAQIKKKEANMKVRMDWWADAWKDYRLGMTFTADTADQFMDRNRTGKDTVYQATEYCANAAEVMKKAFLVPMKKACKEAALERSFKPLYEYLKTMKGPLDGQDDQLSQRMMKLMSKRIINAMRKDELSMRPLADLTDSLRGRAGSVSETYTDEESLKRAWSWDKNDINDFLQGAKGLSGGKVLKKDYANELREFGGAKPWDIFRRHILPIIGMSVLGLALVSLLQGANSKSK